MSVSVLGVLVSTLAFLFARHVVAVVLACLSGAELVYLGLRPTPRLLAETLVEELVVIVLPLVITYYTSLRLFREVNTCLLAVPVYAVWSLYHVVPPLPYSLDVGLLRMWTCIPDVFVALLTLRGVRLGELMVGHMVAHVLWNLSCPLLVYHVHMNFY